MDHRYSLCFETGERNGERIPIAAQGLTVGRRPGNSLQILDNSVSGKHAELVVDAQGVLLRDLGSTNGTRVGPQRVLETRLAHGDRITFGNIELTFHDATLGALQTASPASAVGAEGAAEGVQRTSADLVLRSRKRPIVGLVAIGVLALGAAGLWWWLRRTEESTGTVVRAVEPVAGNLLAEGYSFEGETDPWTPVEGSPAVFLKTAIPQTRGGTDARAPSGVFWMSCELSGGEWAAHESPSITSGAGHSLTARAKLCASSEVAIHFGLEMSAEHAAPADAPHPFVIWNQPDDAGDGVVSIAVTATVPTGYDRARVVVLARAGAEGGGRADFDDVSLVESATGASAPVRLGEIELSMIGDPPIGAVLSKSGKVLVSGLSIAPADAPPEASRTLAFETDGAMTTLHAQADGTAPLALRMVAESPLARARIATVAEGAQGGGFATHALDFERSGVVDLVLGSGRDLLRFKFGSPVTVRGIADGAAVRISANAPHVVLQHDFTVERTEAGNLAHAARNAEKKSELGAALKAWGDLLNRYPYEDALVTEAEAARARLIQQGLEELRALRAEVERARFFRLVDLFRQCRDKARAIGARYSPSEVESESAAVVSEVQRDLAGLEADLSRAERDRLAAIQKALETQKATGLATDVKAYLTERFGEKP